MNYGVITLVVLFLFNGFLYYNYWRNCKKLSDILSSSISRTTYKDKHLDDWEIDNVVRGVLTKMMSLDIKTRVEEAGDGLIQETINSTITNRVSELSVEFAKKYTVEHFEEEMKKKMTDRIGNDISFNLLGNDGNYSG